MKGEDAKSRHAAWSLAKQVAEDAALNRAKHPPLVSVIEAVAAGLPPDAASKLAGYSAKYPNGQAVRFPMSGITKPERTTIRSLCLDVASVVGIGVVDKRVLNHRIRDVLRSMMDATPTSSSVRALYAERMCLALSQPTFQVAALSGCDALDPPCAITRAWLRGGGWKTYWYAIDVLRCNTPQLVIGDGVSVTLHQGLGVALGYERLGL